MRSKTRVRRLLAAGLVLGVLGVVMPTGSIAANVGGGPVPILGR